MANTININVDDEFNGLVPERKYFSPIFRLYRL